jgi:hypothetical protein
MEAVSENDMLSIELSEAYPVTNYLIFMTSCFVILIIHSHGISYKSSKRCSVFIFSNLSPFIAFILFGSIHESASHEGTRSLEWHGISNGDVNRRHHCDEDMNNTRKPFCAEIIML